MLSEGRAPAAAGAGGGGVLLKEDVQATLMALAQDPKFIEYFMKALQNNKNQRLMKA